MLSTSLVFSGRLEAPNHHWGRAGLWFSVEDETISVHRTQLFGLRTVYQYDFVIKLYQGSLAQKDENVNQ